MHARTHTHTHTHTHMHASMRTHLTHSFNLVYAHTKMHTHKYPHTQTHKIETQFNKELPHPTPPPNNSLKQKFAKKKMNHSRFELGPSPHHYTSHALHTCRPNQITAIMSANFQCTRIQDTAGKNDIMVRKPHPSSFLNGCPVS